MAEVRNVSALLSVKVNQFKADMAAAGKAAVDAANKTETAWDKSQTGAGKAIQKIGQYRSEISEIGGAMATFGGIVVGAMGLATKAAMSWQSAWTGVLKTVDGSPKQLAEVEAGLRGLARELPATHEEIAAVAEAAGQLGIETGNVVSFTKTMIDMGESTNLSAEEAATSLARFSNIMGTNQKDIGRLGAAIVGLGNNFATTESEIMEMAMRIAGAGKQANMSEGDVLGLAAALSSVGIDAEAGGTAISMVMKKMGNSVSEGGDAMAGFAEVAGMSSKEFSAAWKDDAAGALSTFIAGLGDAQAAGQNVNGALKDLGITGIRESDALLRLSNASDVLKDALASGNEEYANGIALMIEANKRYDTAESKIRMAGNSIKDSAITIGGTFLPVVAEGSKAVAEFAEWIGKLPKPVLEVGAGLGAIGGAASLAVGGFLLLAPRVFDIIEGFNTLRTQFPDLTTKMGKFGKSAGIAAGVIAAVATAAVAASEALKATERTTSSSNFMEAIVMSGGNAEEILKGVNREMEDVSKVGEKTGKTFTAVDDLTGAFNRLYNSTFSDKINTALGWIPGVESGADKAEAAFRELDTAVTDLASGGSLEAAQAGFKAVMYDGRAAGVSLQETFSEFPEYRKQLETIAESSGFLTNSMSEQEKEAVLLKIAYGEITPAMIEAGAAANGNEEDLKALGVSAQTTEEKIASLADEIRGFGSETLDARAATRAVEAGWDDLNEAIKSGKTSLDDTTESGRKNNEMLDAQIRNINDSTASNIEEGQSVEEVTKKHKKQRDEMVRVATAFFGSEKKAKAYVDQLLKTPDEIETDVKVNTGDATAKLKKTKQWMDSIKDKTVWVRVNEVHIRKEGDETVYSSDPKNKSVQKFKYFGGIDLMPMAAGGVHNNIAEMVKPNTWRIVGDRMDVDEAFIPLDGSRRSWKIMMEAISRMPGAMPMAKGGIASAEKSVDAAQDRLRAARREKQDAKSKKAKAQADRRIRIAEDELESAKKSLKAAKEKQKADEKAAKIAADRAKEERERKARVNDLRTDLRVDLRRGNIRDQVTGGLSGGYSAVDRLYDLGSNQDLSRGSRSRANSSARKFEANLRSLYAQAERIDNRLKKAQDKATELKGIKDSVASGLLNDRDLDVSTSVVSTGDGNFKQVSSLSSMTGKTARLKELVGKLGKLAKMGIPGALLQEVASQGIEGGNSAADALLNAPLGERNQLVSSWAEFDKYANQAGQFVTEGFYKGGVNAADGVVKGLQGKQKNVEAAIANLAKAMESTFKQVLGIHSPSRVTGEIGEFTAEGLVQGMLGGVSDVQSAAAMLGAAAVPSVGAMSMDVGVTPVVADDEGAAGLAMQDMSATTLDAMEQMNLSVSEGFAGMLANIQTAQAGMLLSTQENQLGMLTNTQTQNAAMLLDTQTQQEAMRATVAAKQAGQLSVSTEQQELMRLMLIDKQSQMKTRSETDFEALKNTTGSKFSTMRTNTDTTMSGLHGDYSTRLANLKSLNKTGFESLLSTSNKNMEAIREGIDGEMAAAKPELGGRLNALIGVLSSFTASVNKAFGDVGVKLSAPAALKFASGGVMPGYTPGRDVHQFYSPTAGNLHLSGGEAIMRPEWTRAMGGEAGVKAQNDAARQGRLDDLLHAQSQAFATGGVFGRVPGVNAFADAGVWRNLWAITRDQFPNARLTSAYRGGSRTVSGNASYHSRGMAIDVSPSMDIFNFWRNKYGANLAELIYSPANGKQIKNGSNHYYTGAVRGMHFNHVHIAARQALSDAMAGGLPGMGGEMSHPFLDRAGVTAGSDLQASYAKAAEKLTQQIYAKHAKQLPDGIAGQLGKGIMSQVSEGLVGKAKEYGKTTAISGTTAGDPAVKAAVRKIAEQMGWGKYWGDIDWLVNKESSWNPNAANPSSSARGLFQKMTSLHGPVEDTVEGQARWGLNYIKSTYGNPAAARAHHQRSNWYEGGTERAKRGLAVVGEEGPELVNFQGGEQVMSTADSMKFMAANRTYIPNTAPAFDAATLSSSIASAVKGMQVTPEQIATAFDGVPLQLVMRDGTQMDAYMKKQIGQVAVGAGRAH
ncbi:phage tail tape measure protein [Brevibacterium pigmentatum]|uniref:phage tail tape measure protein n=1 Tax=Brevibacterium pigmentatum TaxID=1496080 RepID=UPI001420CEAA|nr:phage tail tape measure protein [Brevibacterium pigmentatum]